MVPETRPRGDDGVSVVEYALLLALIVLVALGAVTALGTDARDNLDRSGSSIREVNAALAP